MKLTFFTRVIRLSSFLFALSLLTCGIIACKGNKSNKDLTDGNDDKVYISDELLDEENNSEDYEVIDDSNDNTNEYAGPLDAPDTYQNYTRLDDSPTEFAKAAIWHAINMVYPEPFNQPNVELLHSNQDAGRLNLQIKISWSDRWSGPYIIEGVLEINTDGTEGVFTITSKNLNAQSLEFTHDGFSDKKMLPIL